MSISKFATGSMEEVLAQLSAGLQPAAELTISRLPDVLRARGRSRSAHYDDIKKKLFTTPVSIGARAVGWPAREVAILNAARIAGKTDDEISALVVKLIAARKARAWGRGHD
ncbi:MAG: AlpA family phage regulatory protein [Nitrosospira sp.]